LRVLGPGSWVLGAGSPPSPFGLWRAKLGAGFDIRHSIFDIPCPLPPALSSGSTV